MESVYKRFAPFNEKKSMSGTTTTGSVVIMNTNESQSGQRRDVPCMNVITQWFCFLDPLPGSYNFNSRFFSISS